MKYTVKPAYSDTQGALKSVVISGVSLYAESFCLIWRWGGRKKCRFKRRVTVCGVVINGFYCSSFMTVALLLGTYSSLKFFFFIIRYLLSNCSRYTSLFIVIIWNDSVIFVLTRIFVFKEEIVIFKSRYVWRCLNLKIPYNVFCFWICLL